MRAIKLSGLIIFVAGFFLFNFSTFLGSYQLVPETIQEKITDDKKRSLFMRHASEVLGKKFNSNHKFVTALNEVFVRANNEVLERYNITDAEIRKIIEQTHNKFTTPALDSVFRTSNEVAAFKNKAFREYGNALDGKSFKSREEYEAHLKDVGEKIKAY